MPCCLPACLSVLSGAYQESDGVCLVLHLEVPEVPPDGALEEQPPPGAAPVVALDHGQPQVPQPLGHHVHRQRPRPAAASHQPTTAGQSSTARQAGQAVSQHRRRGHGWRDPGSSAVSFSSSWGVGGEAGSCCLLCLVVVPVDLLHVGSAIDRHHGGVWSGPVKRGVGSVERAVEGDRGVGAGPEAEDLGDGQLGRSGRRRRRRGGRGHAAAAVLPVVAPRAAAAGGALRRTMQE